MTTTTQDQLKKEFFENLERFWDDPESMPSGYSDGTDIDLDKIWHWITTVYDQKVREEERTIIKEQIGELKLPVVDFLNIGVSNPIECAVSMRAGIIEMIDKIDELLSQLPTQDKDHE